MSATVTTPPVPATPSARPMTPDEFLRLPDGGAGYELVDGQLQERPVSYLSDIVAGELFGQLRDFVKPRQLGWLAPEGTSYRCFPDDPNRVRRADVSFIALGRMTPEIAKRQGFCEVCPDLVAEVLSPNDVTAEVTRKRREWLAAGARLVWIIDPEDQSVTAYPAGERPVVYQVADTLSGDPVLPGLVIPLADLFRLPTAPPPQPPPQ